MTGSVVVLATADGAAHGAEDPEDHAGDHQDDADGHQRPVSVSLSKPLMA
jgi:hypothetical protein